MAILFSCQSPTCEHRDEVVELLGEPSSADCECGAPMEPVDLEWAAIAAHAAAGKRSARGH